MVKTPGTLKDRFQVGITPVIVSRPEAIEAMEKANLQLGRPDDLESKMDETSKL